MYIGVFAYGESRFNLTFNPCSANINSLCPMNSSIPIEANGIIPVAQADVAGIPSIALSIPDFEGQAILRVFANSTQSQIGCFSAVITNGATFSHPAAIGSVLGIFAFLALISSVAVAIYGQHVPETRKHYAHSLSVLVVFAVFQHIFFTGGLSMNWPSVLVAFWSNYAWSAGMIYSKSMQNTVNNFIGSNRGNISMVGSAPSGEDNVNLGGGFQLSQIYRRALGIPFEPYDGIRSTLRSRELEHSLMRRELVNSSSGFSWYGEPVRPGLPLPGNYSGFAGTLGQLNIPASNAFMTGFLWFLILVALLAGSMLALKYAIEACYKMGVMKTDRLGFYRKHWIGYTAAILLRACFIAFFMMTYLALFQFTLGGATGVQALGGVVFALFLIGMFGIAAYALWYRLRYEKFVSRPDRLNVERKSKTQSQSSNKSEVDEKGTQPASVTVSIPWWRLHFTDVDCERPHVHDDEEYTVKFGWLASRFRRSKWWFFAFWLVYELIRACFYGGAAGHALAQVFGLLAWEIIAFVAVVAMKPFESNRLNLLMVYLLGFSKVATVALSSAFDPRFRLSRILTTVIGVIIIVIQGLLTICLMIAIVLGAISSYMSITRYRGEIKPRSWLSHRNRYFAHMDLKATDKPAPPPPRPATPESPKEPYFSVREVRRAPKIEDEDGDNQDFEEYMAEQRMSLDQNADKLPSRTMSMRSRTSTSNLPYGARKHQASWSTRDFQNLEFEQPQTGPSGMNSRMSMESVQDVANRHRSLSLRGPGPSRSGFETPNGESAISADTSDASPPKNRHRRAGSNPLRPRHKGSMLGLEEKENDNQLIRERTHEV